MPHRIAAEVFQLMIELPLEKINDCILQADTHQIHCLYLSSVMNVGEKVELVGFDLKKHNSNYLELKDSEGVFALIDKEEFCMYVQYVYDVFRPDTMDLADLCDTGYSMGEAEWNILLSLKCLKEARVSLKKQQGLMQ